MKETVYDLAIVGGGINGCGIARDAAGRGLSVFLCEQGDLASGTSSASTKLIHGGLRYLEYYEFRLVREALREREVLLEAAPHIIWPLRFILPHHSGLRPSWLLRLGLFLYDNLGGRKRLPGTSVINLKRDVIGAPLKPCYTKGFEYSDCWVMDSRLVALNAMDASIHGAEIRTQTRCLSAQRNGDTWSLQLQDSDGRNDYEIRAKALINAAGPWVDTFLSHTSHQESGERIRMVKGSHIIVNKLYDHDRAYIFQNADGRIFFSIPYEKEFTLVGTTDIDFSGDPGHAAISDDEIHYLCEGASEYFKENITTGDVVHTYSGIRPLFDDGSSDAKAATRDYILKLDTGKGDTLPLMSIYGGKITTYRKLAESVLKKLSPYLPGSAEKLWTEKAPLPGGNFSPDHFDDEVADLQGSYPFLDNELAYRLTRYYGTQARSLLATALFRDDLGICFGSNLYEAEVRYLMEHEWARTAEDILWRRTSMGLFLTPDQAKNLQEWIDKAGQRKM